VAPILEQLESRRLLAVTVNIDGATRDQSVDGFGTSLAWWVPNLYDTPAWRDAYYQDLGSSMLRVDLNILALHKNPGDFATPVPMVEDLQTNIDQFDWASVPTTQFGGVIQAAAARKIDDFKAIASIWSPPQWMKGPQVDPVTGAVTNKVDVVSGQPMPVLRQVGDFINSIGGSLIDTPDNLLQFGRYVASYVKGYEQHFGVPMYAVSIQNELAFDQVSPSRPTDPFNGFNSCVYSPQIFVDAVKAVADAFAHYGITTKIMGPEATAADEFRYINALRADPAALADLDLYNIHGSVPATFATALGTDDKTGWMTETSGEAATWDGALNLARNAQNALTQGDVSAWLYWQTSDGQTPTAQTLTGGANTTAPKYAAAKHFFRYIRPGAYRVNATPTDPNGVYASAFVHDQQHTLTTVLLNLSNADQTINLHLGGVHVNAFNIARQSTSNLLWQNLASVFVNGDTASFSLPARSVITLQGQTVAQLPFLGLPFAVGAAPVTIQSEDFDNGGEGVAYHDVDAANLGGKYRSTGVDISASIDAGGGYYVGYAKAGEWLEYTIDVATAGSYDLDLRLASAGSNGKFHVEIDGADVTGALTVPNTGGWQTWKTLTRAGVALPQGRHVLRIAMDANGSTGSVGNFNYLLIKPSGSPVNQTPFLGQPFAIGASPITIQAEDYDNGGEGVAYHDVEKANLGGKYRTAEGVDVQTTTDTGGGFNVGYVKAGEWLEYTINVATAGSYDFDFRLAAASSNGKFHVAIDGVDVTGPLVVPNTGAWQTWKTLTKTGVALPQGQHVLRLAMDANGSSGSIGNFNSVTIKPSASASTTITIQAEDFDSGAEGVAYHDLDAANLGGQYRNTGVDIQSTTDAGGGYNLAYVKAGEWLNYTVNLAAAGTYAIDFRVASAASNGKFHLEIDGIDVTGPLTVPNTAGWQNWTTITKTGVTLSAGQHVLKLRMDGNGSTGSVGNFNWLRLRTGS
jgi:O-glycosyl hydrolase